jgi:hypothetical protein
MGTPFKDGKRMRELVKIASDKHPQGYFTGYRDQIGPNDVEFGVEPKPAKVTAPTARRTRKKTR